MVRHLQFSVHCLDFPYLGQTFIKLLLKIYSSPKGEIHYKSTETILSYFFNFLNLIHLN